MAARTAKLALFVYQFVPAAQAVPPVFGRLLRIKRANFFDLFSPWLRFNFGFGSSHVQNFQIDIAIKRLERNFKPC